MCIHIRDVAKFVYTKRAKFFFIENLKALTHYKDFHKDFSKRIVGKTVEKIVVKKSCVRTITTFFAVSVVVCEGLKDDFT